MLGVRVETQRGTGARAAAPGRLRLAALPGCRPSGLELAELERDYSTANDSCTNGSGSDGSNDGSNDGIITAGATAVATATA